MPWVLPDTRVMEAALKQGNTAGTHSGHGQSHPPSGAHAGNEGRTQSCCPFNPLPQITTRTLHSSKAEPGPGTERLSDCPRSHSQLDNGRGSGEGWWAWAYPPGSSCQTGSIPTGR